MIKITFFYDVQKKEAFQYSKENVNTGIFKNIINIINGRSALDPLINLRTVFGLASFGLETSLNYQESSSNPFVSELL